MKLLLSSILLILTCSVKGQSNVVPALHFTINDTITIQFPYADLKAEVLKTKQTVFRDANVELLDTLFCCGQTQVHFTSLFNLDQYWLTDTTMHFKDLMLYEELFKLINSNKCIITLNGTPVKLKTKRKVKRYKNREGDIIVSRYYYESKTKQLLFCEVIRTNQMF